MNITGPLGNFLPWLGVTEEKFRAVERIRLLTENLDDERTEEIKNEDTLELIKSGDLIQDNTHSIIFEDVYLKYDDEMKFVLKNISFKIPYGKKISIIGR